MSEADEHQSMEALYRAQFPSLVRLAFLLTGSTAAAEDAVHEAFTKCASRIPELEHAASYVRAAVVNECRGEHRRRARFRVAEPDGVDELPHEAYQTRAALAELSERRRTAVVLRYFADLDDAEIAEILGCRQATVRSLVHRGLNQLREALT